MKIGLNTYSFRKELEKTKEYTLDDVWRVAENIGDIDGIELLDRHIPGWADGDIAAGIRQVNEAVEKHGWKLYALGPHLKMHKFLAGVRKKEIAQYKRWIDLAADNGIPQIRSQVGGPFGFIAKRFPHRGVKTCSKLLDKVLPYAEERGVQIGMETHWSYSSYPPFLDLITKKYQKNPALGIIFDWGNFWTNEARYQALEIAARPYNHCHNHVKIFKFDQTNDMGDERHVYNVKKIVDTFAKNGFKNYFSIEYEGRERALKGVYRSVQLLKHSISGGSSPLNLETDWASLEN